MRTSAAILLACLLLVNVEGMAVVSTGRCLCMNGAVNFIKPKNIHKVETYAASSSCENMEIIVTLKNTGEQKCLNPESKLAKNVIMKLQRHKRGIKRMGQKP